MQKTMLMISTLLFVVLCHGYTNAAAVPTKDICSLPPETGPCKAFFIRFFHDATDGKCKPFVYGGCGGNKNNFLSLHACQLSCGCPQGEDLVNCLVDPCKFASCSNIPTAVCQGDYCGGCRARFFSETKEVTKKCDSAVVKREAHKCPIDGQVFQECKTCPATCDNPDILCPAVCREGCGCPPGQLIDEDNNRCVDPKQCPSDGHN